MGQVHEATLNGKKLAVKIQYPGVAESIDADLAMIRPFASLLFQVKDSDVAYFLEEVRTRLREEVDYSLEVARGVEISNSAKALEGIFFPKYYPQLSSSRVITMEWMEGRHLNSFLETDPSQEIRNLIGQRIWDLYHFQIHNLRKAHADPHPGNFLFQADGSVGVIDFGCVKELPSPFYERYFSLLKRETRSNSTQVSEIFEQLEILQKDDTAEERIFFTSITLEMIELLAKPFNQDSFDFSDENYFTQITSRGEEISKMKEFRESRSARGPRDALFLNRIYFGLYTLLHTLQARVRTDTFRGVE
jgi:predicted unusual protein kinase regulating ubiquinone biosynthesis (AarF/ABC1/UbiB family)